MKITLNNKYKIEQMSLFFIFVMALFSNYLEHSNLWNMLLFLDFTILILKSRKFRNSLFSKDIVSWMIVLLALISINILQSTSFELHIFTDNMMKLFKTLLSCIMIVLIFTENNEFFLGVVLKNRKILNIIWLINLIVLTVQVCGVPLLIKSEWMVKNPLYADNCTGLFGFSGTHILTFFAMFIFLLNLFGDASRPIRIFNIVTVVWSLILSTKNDNNIIFIMYGFVFIVFKMVDSISKNGNLSKRMIAFLRTLVILNVSVFALYLVPAIQEFVDNVIINKIISSVSFNDYYINGSNERLAIVATALQNGFGWSFGLGIGCNYWVVSDIYDGFRHFGLNSIGSMVFLGGIWFYLFINIFYVYLYYKLWNIRKKPTISYIIILIQFMIFVSTFTTIYTFSLRMIWLTLCFVLIHNIRLRG